MGGCTLWVNDTPDERIGNGNDPAGWHGHHYRDRRMPVAVSFVAENGRAVRVSFDPVTGETHEQDITDLQRGAEA